jgi:DNA uptake protein ComE-like DNA-binding protein
LIDVVETRLDVNMATAEQIFQRVPAITYRTAKRIKALQLAQPGEKWRTLEQLKASAPRLNWDEIFRLNALFINS